MTKARSNATANAAKGDLTVGNGTNLSGVLAVGSNGDTIVADSSTSTGLRWQGSYPAGKNILINGLLDIWQRSTSVTFSGEAYNAQDRWANYMGGSGNTIAQETTTVPAGCRYGAKSTVGASTTGVQASQVIETANAAPYAGQNLTFSGYFQSSATPTIYLIVYYSTSVDVALGGSWTAITATSGGSGTATSGSFARVSGVYAIPSTAKSLKVLWYSSNMTTGQILYWGGLQLEAGTVPTALVRNGATIQGELAACQRYYWRTTSDGTTATAIGQIATASSTTLVNCPLKSPVTMRVKPSSVDFANLAALEVGASRINVTAVALDNPSPDNSSVTLTSSGLVAFRNYVLYNQSGATGYIGFSAEL